MAISGINTTYEIPVHLQGNFLKSFYAKNEKDKTGDLSQTSSEEDIYKFSSLSEISEKERKEVEKLQRRDQEVRQHEGAHQAAAGPLAGTPKYEYENGPDGKKYAVGGNVEINTSEGRTPEETISKAQTIRRAALAPKNPSGQDRKVAQEATQMETEARQEIQKKKNSQASNILKADFPEIEISTSDKKINPTDPDQKNEIQSSPLVSDSPEKPNQLSPVDPSEKQEKQAPSLLEKISTSASKPGIQSSRLDSVYQNNTRNGTPFYGKLNILL